MLRQLLKGFWFLPGLVVLFALNSQAQPPQLTATTGGGNQKSYFEVSRGPHSRVMQAVTTVTNAAGKIITKTNSYTELATGMSHKVGNHWVASSDQIQLTADGAEATNCQHKVHFSANLNSPGAIDLVTPEGHHMASDIAGLVYFDGVTNVVIAIPQDSIGQVLPALNEVLYTNAFSGVDADVLYHHTKAGFEQDIVLRQQLPSPADYGLTASNIWLQVWTKFHAAPSPRVTQSPGKGGDQLDFGIMKMGSGKAFSMGGASNSIPVTKQWIESRGGRFLIESVSLNAIAAQLEQLPAGSATPGSSNSVPASSPSQGGGQSKLHLSHPLLASGSPPRQTPDHIVFPARKTAKNITAPMRLASSYSTQEGFVLDYNTINGSLTNFTFQSDTTYYVSDNLNLYGTTTLEGGTVIKNGQPIGDAIFVYDTFVCQTAPYRPAIFTCTNDDSVGDPISGSSGIPSVIPGGMHLYLMDSGTVSNACFRYGWNSFACDAPDMQVWDCQFLDCMNTVTVGPYNTNVGIHNALMTMDDNINNTTNYCGCSPGGILFYENPTVSVYCEHLTANVQSQNYMSFFFSSDPGAATISLTNCIIVAPALNPPYGDGSSSGATATTNSVYYASTLPTNLFQSVGAGNYYLATNSLLRNAGTTNITPALLADLKQKTTYPPIVFNGGSGAYYTNGSTLFNPQAQRETGGAPDLGYHYDPIDYTFGGIFVTNATFTVTPGTVISALVTNGGSYGLIMGNGGQFLCQGSPVNLCRIINFNTVQEQHTTNWLGAPGYGILSPNYTGNPPACAIACRFTDFSSLAQDAPFFYEICGCANTGTLNFQDCQFHGGNIFITDPTMSLTNCLLERVSAYLWSSDGSLPVIRNNLFYGGAFDFGPSVTNAIVQNNTFYQTSIPTSLAGYGYSGGFNAFLTNSDRMLPTNAADLVLTNMTFLTGPLGNFYQPSNSYLINMGSASATNFGLYHYTVTTNLVSGLEIKETNSIVDIGYHYVATDGSGNPIDSNGNGMPDYLEDSTGRGIFGPQITLIAPTNGAYYAEPATIPLQATVTDWSSIVTNVGFYRSSISITGTTNAPYTYTWPIVAAGAYPLTAIARDLAGLSATSAVVNVTVTNLCSP